MFNDDSNSIDSCTADEGYPKLKDTVRRRTCRHNDSVTVKVVLHTGITISKKRDIVRNIHCAVSDKLFPGRIVNANTGESTGIPFGSARQDELFSVCMADYGSTEQMKLFYKNPEEYERHHVIKLSRDIKEAWYERQMARQYPNTVSVLV